MRNNYILVISMMLICFKICAQQKRVLISGQISSDSIALENIHIINKTSKKATISDKNGVFRIRVKEHDELLISAIQFKNQVIEINKLNISTLKILISLKKEINSLDEVTVRKPKNIAKNLGLPNAGKKPLTKLENRLNAHTKASLPLAILMTLLGNAGGIDDMYYIISGERKKDRKLAKLLERDKLEAFQKKQLEHIRLRLTDNFFIQSLKIPAEKIDNFIIHCDAQDVFYLYSKNRTLEVIDIFIKESEPYLQQLSNAK